LLPLPINFPYWTHADKTVQANESLRQADLLLEAEADQSNGGGDPDNGDDIVMMQKVEVPNNNGWHGLHVSHSYSTLRVKTTPDLSHLSQEFSCFISVSPRNW
jgi:hypothetical protein